jgi:hypothetical protein
MSDKSELPTYTWVSTSDTGKPSVIANFPHDTVLFPKSEYKHEPVARPSFFARIFGGAK